MHIPHGDPLLVHMMMLHKVRCPQIFEMGRFLFDIEGIQLDYGETEYILICGLKVGPYLALQDEDVVLLIQLVFMLKGLHGRDVKTSNPATVYKLADNIDDWNRHYI
uniref:Uncharacterized protein n=1 Tax=Lactuca sativa TaxID=4236 RepID=A0A9R1W0H6_LACSA|nr:hypothetical protein LSAT_V11C400161420 [Lactuca sativa]